jgi:phosphatidylserine/phosphatidylglycerophosphate/cardiolipin synthase-like enzyme
MITEKTHLTDPLPADVAALQALVRELRSELKISTLRGDRLEYKLRDLIRRLYGAKSEKLNPAQRLLFGILEETPIEEPLPPTASSNTPRSAGVPKKKGGGRKPKPENLPIRRQLISLEQYPGAPIETFHAKLLIVDGVRAYVGSANMTGASFESSMELGVILSGEAARQLSRFVEVVVRCAKPWAF